MNERFTTRLMSGQTLTLTAARGPRRLVVTQGRLWLTLGNSLEDHWLCAGQGLTLAAGREVVAEAWPEAEFQLLQPVSPAPRRRRIGFGLNLWRPAEC